MKTQGSAINTNSSNAPLGGAHAQQWPPRTAEIANTFFLPVGDGLPFQRKGKKETFEKNVKYEKEWQAR